MSKKMGWTVLALGACLLIVGVFLYFALFSLMTAGKPVISLQELKDKYWVDKTEFKLLTYYFDGYDSGDEIYIKDVVASTYYNSSVDRTVVWFDSGGVGDATRLNWTNLRTAVITSDIPFLFFKGDVTSKLLKGREVVVMVKIAGDAGHEYLQQLGGPEKPEDRGLTEDDILDMATYNMISIVVAALGGTLIGTGVYFAYVKKPVPEPKVATATTPVQKAPAPAPQTSPRPDLATKHTPTLAPQIPSPKKRVPGAEVTTCPACRTVITIPPAGGRVTCPKCGRAYMVRKPPSRPPPPARQTKCPACGAMITVPSGGGMVRCPQCGKTYKVRGPPAPYGPKVPAATKCPACGGEIPLPATRPTTVKCPSCGRSYKIA